MSTERINSPARAGRRLLARIPTRVAQRVVTEETGFSALSKTPHRKPRRKYELLNARKANTRKSRRACLIVLAISSQATPRSARKSSKPARKSANKKDLLEIRFLLRMNFDMSLRLRLLLFVKAQELG